MSTQIPILEALLAPIGKFTDPFFRHIASVIITAVSQQASVIISHPENVDPSAISPFIEFAVTTLCNLSVTTILADNSCRSTDKTTVLKGRKIPQAPREPATYVPAHCLILEKYPSIFEEEQYQRVLTKGEQIAGRKIYFASPFVLFQLVPETMFLPINLVRLFPLHLNLQITPAFHLDMLPKGPIYDNHQKLKKDISAFQQVFVHRDVSGYIGHVTLKLDTFPLATTFINPKQKIFMDQATQIQALLNGRNFVIPDDAQTVFMLCLSHRFLVPGDTTFANTIDHLNKILDVIPVPV